MKICQTVIVTLFYILNIKESGKFVRVDFLPESYLTSYFGTTYFPFLCRNGTLKTKRKAGKNLCSS